MKLLQKVIKVSFEPLSWVVSSLCSELEPGFGFHVQVLFLVADVDVETVELVAFYNVYSPFCFFFVLEGHVRHVDNLL